MKSMNKARAYAALKEIKNNKGIDVSKYVQSTALSEQVSVDTVVFINKHKPLEQFYTYNKIHENRRKNPLYKNLVNENLSVPDMAIALSSLVTQAMIHNKELLKENKVEDADEFLDIMNLDSVFEALKQYADGNSSKLVEVFKDIRNTFKLLY